jgi:hypothetical protein
MAGASLLSWLAVTALARPAVNPEVLLGMLGPLVGTAGTVMLTERVHAVAPRGVMRALLFAFGAKVVFFGGYVVAMLEVLELRPVPFMVSFTCYFVALYGIEALFLKRLLQEGTR